MTIQIDRQGVHDISRSNGRNIVYVKGNAFTDGSIRIMFDDNDPDPAVTHIELMTNGVWNDTGFRFSATSVFLGRDLILSAVAGFIETRNPSAAVGHVRALVPHIEFGEQGTIESAHMPITDFLKTFSPFPGPATGEVTGATIGQIINISPTRILDQSLHEVGSIGATAPIQVSFYVGTDNAGLLVERFNLPASDWVANQPLIIEYNESFGIEANENLFQEFTSVNALSLKTNAAGDIITDHTGHQLAERDIILDELVLDEEMFFVFDNNLGFVTNNRFP